MECWAVLFDLDGTLLDTLADIAEAADRVLVEFGFPTHGTDAYRRFVGDGVRALFSRVLPPGRESPALIARCMEAFRAAYEQHWNRHTRPYHGIPELLESLKTRDVKMAVLSNKPDPFTQLCVGEYFAPGVFEIVVGYRDGVPRKPDPAGADHIARKLGISPGHFVYLGDTPTDMQTARAAGMWPVGVRWGFRPADELEAAGAEALIGRPGQLVEMIEGGSADKATG